MAREGVSADQVIREARQAADGYLRRSRAWNARGRQLPGPAWGAAGAVLASLAWGPVSYTHLDVYKRQVSDPVDPLAKTAYLESNRDENGVWDGKGLRPEQIQGFGLGVMNARAAYFAKRDPRLASFLTEGRSFGPHGTGLFIANSCLLYTSRCV